MAERPADPLAVGALVLALVAFVCDCCCLYLGPPLSLIALVLGVFAAVKARKHEDANLGVAIAAIGAAAVNLLLFAGLAVFVLVVGGMTAFEDGEFLPIYPDGPPPQSQTDAPGGGPMLPPSVPLEPHVEEALRLPPDEDGGSSEAAGNIPSP